MYFYFKFTIIKFIKTSISFNNEVKIIWIQFKIKIKQETVILYKKRKYPSGAKRVGWGISDQDISLRESTFAKLIL